MTIWSTSVRMKMLSSSLETLLRGKEGRSARMRMNQRIVLLLLLPPAV
jgi:hypothetical protein